jgi:hypothetical protein
MDCSTWDDDDDEARQIFYENGQVKTGLLNKHFEIARAEDERLIT